jgi:hypothetical protein
MKHEHFRIATCIVIGLVAGAILPLPYREPADEPAPRVYNDPIIAPAFQTVKPIEMELGVEVTSITVKSLVERLNEAGDPESVVVVATPDGFATIGQVGAFDVSVATNGKPVIILGKDLGAWVEKNFPAERGGTR